MFIKRDLTKKLLRFANFPAVVLLGPRQSGKTTLVKEVFPYHTYLNLENLALRAFAQSDPQAFLAQHENTHGLIIDEFQYVPDLLSYIQVDIDAKRRPGYFILTGSQNFLTNKAITQSLAGRIGILTLLPLSLHELKEANLLPENALTPMYNGFYPHLYAHGALPQELYPSYIQTYLERDVRDLTQVGDLSTFRLFIQLCAGRVGQLLNIADLAMNCSIDQRTVKKWLSILESSYILFLLRPHFNNFNKRLTQSPKLYFYDTGLVCSLLGLRSDKDLLLNPYKGHLFENMIIADIYKQYYNMAIQPPLYFWRDINERVEVDCLIDKASTLIPIEIKSGQTIQPQFFDALDKWNVIANADPSKSYIIYAGDASQKRSKGHIIGWQEAATLISKIEE